MRRTPVDATKALGSIADFTFRFIVAILRKFLRVCQVRRAACALSDLRVPYLAASPQDRA